MDLEEMPKRKRFLLRPLRVLVLALQGFDENQIRASALTFYTMLAMVPVAAVVFGIAKGFGLQEALEGALRQGLENQEMVATQLIELSNAALEQTRGALVAGVGVIVLLWSVVRLLGYIEMSFNQIWGIRKGRPFGRRVLEYLSFILVAPLLITASSAITANVSATADRLSQDYTFISRLVPGTRNLIAYGIISFLLFASYKFVPNTKVSWRSSLFAALVAGTLYQLTQWGYFKFLTTMTSFSVVYGTLVALPLFLILLQIGWLVVLFGAEISFAVDNEETYALERSTNSVSQRLRRVIALRITEMATNRFRVGQVPLQASDVSHELSLPVRLVRDVLQDLVDARVLSAVSVDEDDAYQPARAIESLTVQSVIHALDVAGRDEELNLDDRELSRIRERLAHLDTFVRESPDNVLVHEI
jgi:membrane protein